MPFLGKERVPAAVIRVVGVLPGRADGACVHAAHESPNLNPQTLGLAKQPSSEA